jgi:hypothetical protein
MYTYFDIIPIYINDLILSKSYNKDILTEIIYNNYYEEENNDNKINLLKLKIKKNIYLIISIVSVFLIFIITLLKTFL